MDSVHAAGTQGRAGATAASGGSELFPTAHGRGAWPHVVVPGADIKAPFPPPAEEFPQHGIAMASTFRSPVPVNNQEH